MERQSDLIVYKPTELWILGLGEEPPEGTAVHVTATGIRVAFRPVRIRLTIGVNDHEDRNPIPIQ